MLSADVGFWRGVGFKAGIAAELAGFGEGGRPKVEDGVAAEKFCDGGLPKIEDPEEDGSIAAGLPKMELGVVDNSDGGGFPKLAGAGEIEGSVFPRPEREDELAGIFGEGVLPKIESEVFKAAGVLPNVEDGIDCSWPEAGVKETALGFSCVFAVLSFTIGDAVTSLLSGMNIDWSSFDASSELST